MVFQLVIRDYAVTATYLALPFEGVHSLVGALIPKPRDSA